MKIHHRRRRKVGRDQRTLDGLKATDHQIGHRISAVMAGHVLAGRLALGAGFIGVGEHPTHQRSQVGLGGIGPVVTLVVPQLRLELAGFDHFIVEEVAGFLGHEFRIRAPVGRNHGALHEHGLVLRASPSLPPARGHIAVAGEVQARQLVAGHLVGDEFDAGQVLVPESESCGEVRDATANFLRRIALGFGEQVSAQPQAHVVVGRELAQISGQQDVPALAGGPLENGQEVESGLVGQRVDRVPGRIEKLRIHRTRDHHQFRAFHPTGREGLDIVLRRHPNLIHPIAGRDPLRRDAIGLEHRAPNAVVGVGEASEEPCRAMGDANAATERSEPVAHPEQRLAVCSGKASSKCRRFDRGIMENAESAPLLQRQDKVDRLAGVTTRIEERGRPAQGEARFRRSPMHLTPGWSHHHGVPTIIVGGRTVAIEGRTNSGLP